MNIIIDSKFRPFTYDEMVKPLVQYKEEYDKIEEDYSDLMSQTEMWRNIANRDKSPLAYEMYNRYSNDLSSIVDDFSRGMNLTNRKALLQMKKRYAQDIEPISKAHERQQKLADEQRAAELSNPTMLWQKRAADMSLDEFISDPDADYGHSYSGAALSAEVAAAAGALANEFRDNPEKMKKLVGGDYYEYIQKRGFSSEAVLAAIMDNPNASPILTQLVESAIDAAGIKDWSNDTALQQAYHYAKQGLWNAVGKDEAQLVANWRAQENLSHSHALARQRESQAFQAQEAEKERAWKEAHMPKKTELLDDEGNPSGIWYDPDLGGYVTGDNKMVIPDKNGQLTTPGGNKVTVGGGKTPGSSSKGNSDADKQIAALKTVSSVADMKKQGYTPAFATLKLSGQWYSRKEGEDAPDTFGSATRSNLVSSSFWEFVGGGGNITFSPERKGGKDGGVTWVDPGTDPNNPWPSIPAEAKASLAQQYSTMNLRDDQDIQILRVRSERGDGTSGNDYDYIICVSN